MSLPARQSELVDTHRAVHDRGLPYVLVGGWAVTAFQTRFTTDVDMVVPREALEEYDTLLSEMGYSRETDVDVSGVYEGRMVRYTKEVDGYPVEFDGMVDSLRCRQTDAEWSYRYLAEHSVERSLQVTSSLQARIPEPALLFAIKVHSGRLADTRDLVVVGDEANASRIRQHIYRGDPESLSEQIALIVDRIEEEDFEDSFKGVFRQQRTKAPHVDEVVDLLRGLQDP